MDILNELKQREPIFHHPEFGTTRQDFERMTDEAFVEVGASGRQYSREYILEDVLKRYENPEYRGIHAPPENTWKTKDFHCHTIAPNTYLLTYILIQDKRVTRRVSIWQQCSDDWKILYHQGTLVQDPSVELLNA
ncbi:MAG: hypothetical protein VKJ02_15140 [Snowella sp.]|nr:hypothetical protein [Snowella sp.]